MSFVKRMDNNVAKHKIGIWMKNDGSTRLFEW